MREQAKKARTKRKVSCSATGKARFKSEAQAAKTIRRIAEDPFSTRKPQRAYYCTDCAGWHLTSMQVGDGRYDYHL